MEKTESLYNLTHYNIRPEKKYGQNFLIDDDVLEGIIRSSGTSKEDFVLEIGPGMGALTKRLSKAAGSVLSVEIDEKLIMLLEETVGKEENVTVINADILKTDIKELFKEYNKEGRNIRVVANLPYYITSPILLRLLNESRKTGIRSITVMVQREVAERLNAVPGTKDYGALTLLANYYAKTRIDLNVPPECFLPPPGVDSAVMTMEILPEAPVPVKDEEKMMRIIRASFNQRRKTLLNALKNSPEVKAEKEKTEKAIKALGKEPTVRGETLTLEEFSRLSDEL